MPAKYILAVLSVVFLILAARGLGAGRAARHPQTRTHLIVGAIFALVALWLFSQDYGVF
jgi:hypothetical protein